MHCPCHTFRPNGDIIENANEVLEVKFKGETAFHSYVTSQGGLGLYQQAMLFFPTACYGPASASSNFSLTRY